MSEDKKELPELPEMPGAAAPTQNVVVVQPQLLSEVLRLLQDELPMSKCRAVVQALEQCQIAQVPTQPNQ